MIDYDKLDSSIREKDTVLWEFFNSDNLIDKIYDDICHNLLHKISPVITAQLNKNLNHFLQEVL